MYDGGSSTVAIRAPSANCCGLGHGDGTLDILLWLMTGDTCKICDLWRSCPCWSHTRRGISRGPIPAESCRNGHRRDSSLSHRSCCWEIPCSAALCDTFFTGQLSASGRSAVLKCGRVQCARNGGSLSFRDGHRTTVPLLQCIDNQYEVNHYICQTDDDSY